jgi:hypothetical protein
VTNAIRAELTDEGRRDRNEAIPVIDSFDGVSVYTMPFCKSHVTGITASPDALDQARKDIIERLQSFVYGK